MRFNTPGLLVLIGGITNDMDALLAVGLGATGISFDFGPTPWQVSPNDVQFILRRLPPGVLTLGVFRNETPQRIVEITNTLGLSASMLYGTMSTSEIEYVACRVPTVLRVIPQDSFVTDVAHSDYLVVPEVDTLDELRENIESFYDDSVTQPMIVSGGLTADNVTEIVQTLPMVGVYVLGGVEVNPGVKDPGMLQSFIANAKWGYENPLVDDSRS